LKTKYALGIPLGSSEVSFAASHFYELDLNRLGELNVLVLECIISSPDLRLKDEGFLLDFICTVDCDRHLLLRYLRAEYLSCASISTLLCYFSCSNVDSIIWSSLQRRLLLPISDPAHPLDPRFVSEKAAESSSSGVECPLKTVASLDGIISYLTAKHEGNVHEKELVVISAKSICRGSLMDVAELACDTFLMTKDGPSQWICWDFRGMRVRPTHYTMISYLMKTWVVEGSLDGSTWTVMDRHMDTLEYSGGWNKSSFAVANPMECRFVRLVQLGPSHSGTRTLYVRAFELFGELFD
jgi:hypothetical protein